jgi:hypothetical protein
MENSELIKILEYKSCNYVLTDDNLSVGGSLDLEDMQITALPDNLSVGGSLDLRGTQITALPDNLSVGGSLDLEDMQITALPDNLSVGGSLYLRGTQITALPDNLSVGGSLYLRGTQITALPDNLIAKALIQIENSGKWSVLVSKSEIKIGCKGKGILEWKDFFKNKRSYSTDPESEDYRMIVQDFENALKYHKAIFKKK